MNSAPPHRSSQLAPPAPVGRVSQPRSSDFMNVLAEVESLFPTHEWRVAGISIWPLVRLRWFFAEWTAHYAQPDGPEWVRSQGVSYVKRALRGLVAATGTRIRDARANDRGPPQRDFVFLSDGLSFSRLGTRWVERFCDPLMNVAGSRGWTSVLWTPLHTYHQPRFTPSLFVQPGVDTANIAGALRAGTTQAYLPGHKQVLEWLASRGFGTKVLQREKIASDGCRIRAVADLYRRKLARVRPRLAFLVSYYSVEGMAFVLACRERGIAAVDIQHGVQGEMHPAYAAWSKPAGDRHALLPDRFWVWSDWEAGVISRWSAGTGHRAIVGGNPWMNVWQGDGAWPGVTDAIARARTLRQRAGQRPVVLVTLQYGLTASEQLDPVVDLVAAAGERFAFWIRLHPAMLERRQEVRAHLGAAGSFELDECTDLPLQALLLFCDVHLTHSSSSVIDAAQFGVCSIVTTQYGAELFARLLTTGRVLLETGGAAAVVVSLARLAAAGASRMLAAPPIDAALDELLAGVPIDRSEGNA